MQWIYTLDPTLEHGFELHRSILYAGFFLTEPHSSNASSRSTVEVVVRR